MPRIRTVKPEFWGDEKLSPMRPIDRLVFLGLISMADDAGRVVDNAKVIDAFVFPNTADSATESVNRLSAIGRLKRGVTSSGQKVIQIANWLIHQKIEKPNLRGCLPEILVGEASGKDRGNVGEASVMNQRPTTNDLRPEPEPTTNRFAEIWDAYPKRPNNSKAAAKKAYDARLKAGVTHDAMLAGVVAYAAFCTASKTEPRFIKMASTFLGPDHHFESDYTPTLPRTALDDYAEQLAAEANDFTGVVA